MGVLRGFLILLHIVLCISSGFKMIWSRKTEKIGVGISSRITKITLTLGVLINKNLSKTFQPAPGVFGWGAGLGSIHVYQFNQFQFGIKCKLVNSNSIHLKKINIQFQFNSFEKNKCSIPI